ncbi:MAG: helix-turn-helix domain-containing protein [Spirochaetaceae bacterium]|nr:helix-turn-helix domain-containing protein [Spirochaetaceae bacterium]
MLKVVFFADSQDLYAEYILRLKEKNIQYWAVTGGNDFYRLQAQIHIDILFLDYQMFDHNLFDVRDYVKTIRKDLIVLFFNYPKDQPISILSTWQDELSLHYKDFISEELYLLLELICSPRNEPLMNNKLLETKAEIIEAKGDYSQNQIIQKNDINNDINKDNFNSNKENGTSENTVINLVNNNMTLYYYSKIKNRFKIGFSEYMLLNYLYARRNTIVSMEEMVNLIWQDNSNSHVNTLYSYVHSLRNFLCNIKIPASIIRVKKGYYSLIVEKEISVSELNLYV